MVGDAVIWWIIASGLVVYHSPACPNALARSDYASVLDAWSLQAFLSATLPRRLLPTFSPSSSSVCTWRDVLCLDSTHRIGKVFLENLGLHGPIPPKTLGDLTSLSHLSLYNNSVSGTLPADLWNLTALVYLSLSRNSFDGPIGNGLGKLSSLQRLDLSHNRFNGSIPTQLQSLHNLRYAYLSFNAFSGSLSPDVLASPSLISIDLSHNRLEGPLPTELGALPNLITLNVSANQFSGIVPEGFSNLNSLDVSYNAISGSLATINGSTKLQVAIFSHNKFSGSLPKLISSQVVILNHNALSGPLQPGLFSSKLTILDISHNSVTGDVASFVGTTPSLQYLDLSYNNLSINADAAEESFLKLTDLKYLNLSHAYLQGQIPESFGQMSNLSMMDLSNNNLSGGIPASFIGMSSLEFLDLSWNDITGNVSHLSALRSLKQLNLSYNRKLACSVLLLSRFGSSAFMGVEDCGPLAANIGLPGAEPAAERKHRTRFWVLVLCVPFGCIIAVLGVVCIVRRKRRGSQTWPGKMLIYANETDSRMMSGPFSFESYSGPWAANIRNPTSVPVVMFEKPLLTITFADLLRATGNFAKEAQVSQGGLGPVYTAILPENMHVSIKVLIEGRLLTNQEALVEFAVLASIKHPNVVPLVGYCIVGEERLVIYEFMKNGGLHRWLHGSSKSSQLLSSGVMEVSRDLAARDSIEKLPDEAYLSWCVRHKIALGLARALAFLHHGQSRQVVHRDVKASNVMLDEDFEAHLANTGLYGLLAGSNRAAFAGGTPGYIPPEYSCSGQQLVTPMGDVYSYGVILLELVTGKRPVGAKYDEDQDAGIRHPNLVGWVRGLMQGRRKGGLLQVLDARALLPALDDEEDESGFCALSKEEQMLEVLRIGYLCTAESPCKRPTMQQVVGLLKDIQQTHHQCSPPVRGGFC